MITTRLIQSAKEEASAIILNLSSQGFEYHNLDHTNEVVAATSRLATALKLSESDILLLTLAAWFHDTGYSDIEHHETKSAEIAERFLTDHGCDDDLKKKVRAIILSTKISESPSTLLEEIIRDADLHYLGATDYFERADRLRKEWELTLSRVLTDDEWHQLNLDFFHSHMFHTQVARDIFGPGKTQNQGRIAELIQSY